MPVTDADTTEAAILSRVIDPTQPTFDPEAARAILALDFSPEDKTRYGRCRHLNRHRKGRSDAAIVHRHGSWL